MNDHTARVLSSTAHRALVGLLLISFVLGACSTGGGGDDAQAPAGQAGQPPAGTPAPVTSFTAEVTSPVSVMLRWPAATEATRYLIEVKYGDLEFFPLAEVGSDKTSYEDFPAPDDMDLTYRLQIVSGGTTAEGGTAAVRTPVQEPNPLTVQAYDYEPVAWQPPPVDLTDPNFDPSSLYPPGFDPDNPEAFDPSSMMTIPSVTEVIGPEGGAVSMTSPDDVAFTLTIPAGAMDAEIPITLTPVESIDGLPLSGGLLGAVRIEPDGLQLEIPALLQISLPEGATVPAGNEMYAFAFDGEGQEFHLEPLAPEGLAAQYAAGSGHRARPADAPLRAGPLAKIAAKQIRSYGTGAGTQDDARSVAQNHRPTSSRDAAANLSGAKTGSALGKYATQELMELSVRARFVEGWLRVGRALDSLASFLERYGDRADPKIVDEIWDQLLDKLHKLMKENRGKCITVDDLSAQAIAQRLLNPPKGSFAEKLADRFVREFGRKVLQDVAAIKKDCTYALKVESEIWADFPDQGGNVRYIVRVAGEVPLKWVSVDGTPYLTGAGSLTYADMGIDSRSKQCTPIKYEHPNKAYILVVTLKPIFTDGPWDDYDLSAFIVVDAPGAKFDFTCTVVGENGKRVKVKGSAPMLAGKSVWYGMYAAAHAGDVSLTKWRITDFPGNVGMGQGLSELVVAEKIFHRIPFTPENGWGEWVEKTKFSLILRKTK